MRNGVELEKYIKEQIPVNLLEQEVSISLVILPEALMTVILQQLVILWESADSDFKEYTKIFYWIRLACFMLEDEEHAYWSPWDYDPIGTPLIRSVKAKYNF